MTDVREYDHDKSSLLDRNNVEKRAFYIWYVIYPAQSPASNHPDPG